MNNLLTICLVIFGGYFVHLIFRVIAEMRRKEKDSQASEGQGSDADTE